MMMHVGMLAAILVIFGLSALGVAIPQAVVYLVVLACPLMMVFMMFGMDHDHDHDDTGHQGHADHDRQPSPPANATK
jgi:hypothetical protein